MEDKQALDGDFEYRLGEKYLLGEGVEQDCDKAMFYLRKAADQGNMNAQSRIGYMYHFGACATKDYKKAVLWFMKAAEQGEFLAQGILGENYYLGLGVTKNIKKAIFWHRKSAEQGFDNAQYHLGLAYYRGEGVEQNYKMAVFWSKKAAEQGHSSAQVLLGYLYRNGLGVTQNYKFAYVWSSLAALQGNKTGIENRDVYARSLTPHQLSQAQELATKFQYEIDHPDKSDDHQQVNNDQQNQQKVLNGSGTGFLVTNNGYIVTCHHVIQNAEKIQIIYNGQAYSASLVRNDPNNDLALLKSEGSFPSLAFSLKRSAKMGQGVFTIGYPNPGLQGVSPKYTKGTISSLTGFQDDFRLYQISVPVQPGNSGGALVDENGNVIGIIIAMLNAKTVFKTSGSLPQNVNYAVKSTYIQAVIDSMPEVAAKLPSPAKNNLNAVERVKQSTVMVLSYKKNKHQNLRVKNLY
ncbi:MAG: trypsin-like peptidase domain-containing protein [Deltaproteobacteria bacterium]|nr:trypsin-like peptidase domain-containing protein [Deltaproteobacteria bacterium]